MSQRITIKSRFNDYSVVFLPTLKACIEATDVASTHYLVDSRVHELYNGVFDTIPLERCILWTASEENKTYQAVESLFGKLVEGGFKKSSRLVVIGGGVLQDVGGFAASILYRGVTWDLIPTTLLAQADSCIGAKTSINLPYAKNLLGSFYPPQKVLLTTEVLKTLSHQDIQSGLVEALKLAMIAGADEVEWMRPRLAPALTGQGLDEILFRALTIKKSYIEEDELDKGVRNLLNYGHTFGHAFESVSNYDIPHGIAVGLGMQAAAYFSVRLGLAPKEFFSDTKEILDPLVAPFDQNIKSFKVDDLVQRMKADKKNTSNAITFILGKHGELVKHALQASEAAELLTSYIKNESL